MAEVPMSPEAKTARFQRWKYIGIVVAALMFAVGNYFSDLNKNRELAKQIAQEATSIEERYTAKFEDLQRRFTQGADFDRYVAPEGLTSPSRRAAGIEALRQHRALLDERKAIVKSYVADTQAFVMKLPAGPIRANSESMAASHKARAQQIDGLLDRTLGEHAAALEAIFTWAQANAGKISLRNGEMILTSTAQQKEWSALAARMNTAVQAANDAIKKNGEANAVLGEQVKKVQQDMTELLAK